MSRKWWNDLGAYRSELAYTADSIRMIKLGLMLQLKAVHIPLLPFCLYMQIKSRFSFSSINKEAFKTETKIIRSAIFAQLNGLKSFAHEDVKRL